MFPQFAFELLSTVFPRIDKYLTLRWQALARLLQTACAMSGISPSTAAYYNSLAPQRSNWLADAFTAIRNQASQGGILGALQNGGVSASQAANAFATISLGNMQSTSQLAAQQGSAALQQRSQGRLQQQLDQLKATTTQVAPQNVLDPYIYFSDGSYIDTNKNILTMSNGTQIDTTTGLRYVDPASVIQLANGAYIDTQNNIMFMPDGTEIDTVTGLTIGKTA